MGGVNDSMFKRVFRQHPGWYVLIAAIGLSAIGVHAIDTVEGIGRVPDGVAAKQRGVWLPVAGLAMLMCFLPHPRSVGLFAYVAYGFSLLLLVFLLMPGVPRSIVPIRNGARSWIEVPGGNVQPSELAKITFILAVAWYLRYRESYRTLVGMLVPFALMVVPLGLILKQPDLGTAMIFPPALLGMLIAAGAKMRHLIGLGTAALLVAGLVIGVIVLDPPDDLAHKQKLPSWAHVLQPHQEKRIAALVYTEKYEKDEAFQQTTAMRVAAAGGWSGHGKAGSQTLVRYSRLPEPHNDMIYAVIVNRWGALGGLLVLGLYAMLVWSMLLTAGRSREPFARLACVGFAGAIFAQATINIAMNLKLMPITGITLPFISYGGSSLLATYIMVGLTLNFATRKPARVMRPSFEHDTRERFAIGGGKLQG